MIWTYLTEKFNSVIKSPTTDKYYQFIRKIVGLRKIWVLKANDGWLVTSTRDGHKLLLVWSNQEYAHSYSKKNLLDAIPVAVDICDFLLKWMPDMLRDKIKILLFPALEANGVLVSVKKLQDDIEDEQEYS